MIHKKAGYALILSAAMLTAACGGGGSSGSSENPSGGTSPMPQSTTVAGPLDTVQTAVTSTVFVPLVSATAGTPLQPVLLCANGIATRNLLDIADAFANGLASPATLATTAPAQAQAAVTALVGNLSGLLTSLNGTQTCLGGSTAPTAGIPTTNPLAGTPLAALGDQLLPILLSASQQLAPGAGGVPSPLSALQLAGIVEQLSNAFSTGLASLPSEVLTAPILGGSLVTVDDALAQLASLTDLAASGATPQVLATSFQTLAESVINNLLTQVLPVANLQTLAGGGAPTDLVATLQAAVASLTAGLGTSPTTPLPANPLGGVGFEALTGVINQLVTTLPTALTGTAGLTPLAAALGQVQTLLGSLLGLGGSGGGTGGGSGGGCLLGFLGLCPAP
ncbi:MAG: hypothetical protein C0434_01585 [Xanthomonadaceae bacterium]|nr:hypothetical protein [Xanthomonadaceae bacterium]